MRPTVDTGERQGYAAEMAGLWASLERVLRRLERIASHPDEELEEEDALDTLSVLQYGLHCAGELAIGIDPPPDAEWAHHELASALTDARDATASVAEATETGGAETARVLVPEWRGSLFRVRLAQMRLRQPARTPPLPYAQPGRGDDRAALAATLLVLAGTFVVVGGAVVGIWPLWAAGLVLVAGGFFVYRP